MNKSDSIKIPFSIITLFAKLVIIRESIRWNNRNDGTDDADTSYLAQ